MSVTIMIIVYKMVVLHMAYCTCTVLLFSVCSFLFPYCMIILFVEKLFLYLGGQSVSCKASLAAIRLYGYFSDFCLCYYRKINMMMMMMMMLSLIHI